MVYIVTKQMPHYRQLTLDDILFQDEPVSGLITDNHTNTKTCAVERANQRYLRFLDMPRLTGVLQQFNERTQVLRQQPREELYHSFLIPKRSGGLRRIDAPQPQLMDALRSLKVIFEKDFHALYHTSAFAYIPGRSTVDAVRRHQQNASRWFLKLDLHDFFGSTTMKFLFDMLSMIYPFSEAVKDASGAAELKTALELAFYRGGLPQGTPLSPLLTNLMMIPVDFHLTRALRSFHGGHFVYTRYADDFLISCRYKFDPKPVEEQVSAILRQFHAPFAINAEKTRFGSNTGSGANWNLGVMLNKDNEITVGWKNKKRFQTMLFSYASDKRRGIPWPAEDLRSLNGLYSYYLMVEGGTIRDIVCHVSKKTGMDILQSLRQDAA